MERYNGWKNYETWCVNLWIDNDGSQAYFLEEAERICGETEDRDDATRELSDLLKDSVEENRPLPDAGMYCDLLGAALSEVDWYEIAEGYITDEFWAEAQKAKAE